MKLNITEIIYNFIITKRRTKKNPNIYIDNLINNFEKNVLIITHKIYSK